MANKTVAVTGIAGYIGRVLVQILLERGYDVIGIDQKYISPDKMYKDEKGWWTGKFTPYCGNFAQHPSWQKHLEMLHKDGNLLGLVHLAADSLLGPSVNAPIPYFLNNVNNSTTFLEYLLSRKIYTNFIFASSAAVYGDTGNAHPIHTFDPKEPINPYGRTKLQFEEILIEAAKAHGFTSTSFRFFNVVGGYHTLGQPSDQPHIITSILRASTSKQPFVLKGTNYPTYDGTPVRDYIHVVDVCEAILFRLRNDQSFFPHVSSYNLCTGRGTSNREIVERFIALHDKDLRVEESDARPGDPAYLIGDPYDLYPWQSSAWSSIGTILETAKEAFLWQLENPLEPNPAPPRISYADLHGG